ncbi:hypothetical protein [Rhizobium arsenicireducens]
MNDINNWHPAALADLENTSMTVSEIGLKYGRSPRTIERLLYQSKIVRLNPNKRRGPKRRENMLPVSRQHHAIGIRLNMYRANVGVREFANRIGVSVPVLMSMEVGQHDFKLSQLLKICEVTGLVLGDLMRTFESNIYQGSKNAQH